MGGNVFTPKIKRRVYARSAEEVQTPGRAMLLPSCFMVRLMAGHLSRHRVDRVVSGSHSCSPPEEDFPRLGPTGFDQEKVPSPLQPIERPSNESPRWRTILITFSRVNECNRLITTTVASQRKAANGMAGEAHCYRGFH